MFKLDNNLLEELGLGGLPAQEKNQMLKHIYETLEMRVGMKLAEQMSKEQLDEFDRFVSGDITHARSFLDSVNADWEQSEKYQKQSQAAQLAAEKTSRPFNEAAVISEFAALTWLETNFPNYKQVVAAQLDNLKQEIKSNAQQILSAVQQPPEA